MNFMRSEMSRKQRMACCNEVWVSVLRVDVRARGALVLRIGGLCGRNALYTYGRGDCRILEHSAGAVCACFRNEMQHTYHTGAVPSSQ
jgi:hypothetical protein